MAKIGEGDPRWIVSERKDGINVNSWHWEERDLSNQVHTEIQERLKGFTFLDDGSMTLKVKEVSDISGDVTVAQRKSKIMCYFEVKMTIKWTGSAKGESDKIDGKLTIPEIEHDNFAEDFDITISAAESNPTCQKAEQWMRSNSRKMIRDWMKNYFNEVFKANNVGMNVKTGQPAAPATPGSSGTTPKPATTSAPADKPAAKPAASSSDAVTSFSWKIEWRCPVEELFTVLTDAQRASAYTRSPAKVDPQPSGEFNYLGGAISGYYVKVQPNEALTMQWRLQNWASGKFSSVIINLSKEEAGVTRMEFAQAGIPEGEVERVKQGWQVNFWDPIRIMFGYQSKFL